MFPGSFHAGRVLRKPRGSKENDRGESQPPESGERREEGVQSRSEPEKAQRAEPRIPPPDDLEVGELRDAGEGREGKEAGRLGRLTKTEAVGDPGEPPQ